MLSVTVGFVVNSAYVRRVGVQLRLHLNALPHTVASCRLSARSHFNSITKDTTSNNGRPIESIQSAVYRRKKTQHYQALITQEALLLKPLDV